MIGDALTPVIQKCHFTWSELTTILSALEEREKKIDRTHEYLLSLGLPALGAELRASRGEIVVIKSRVDAYRRQLRKSVSDGRKNYIALGVSYGLSL